MRPFMHSYDRWRARRGMNSTRLVVLSFGGVILLGTLLLMLPAMSRSGESAGVLTSLFTATSATCVTGLAVTDTLTQWNLGGQIVILCLIQLGGLGFMTAYTLLLTLMRREICLSQRMAIASTLNLQAIGGVVKLARHALMGTVLFEGTGAVLLSLKFVPLFGLWKGIWYSVFHSVSAFCNAGFDLMGLQNGESSLGRFAADPMVLLVHMALIVLGGLSFFVWEDIYQHRRWKKFSLYSRLVLGITGVLIAAGWIYFLLAEWTNPATLGSMPLWEKSLNALFQSVTLRTAGFASFNQGGLWDSSQVVSLLFMFIGGSSGSTAGGIKTVTAGVIVLALWCGLHGREEVTIRGRTVPRRQVTNATTLTLTMVLIVFVCSVAISLLDQRPYLPVIFEVVSALGTVGVSTGITADLSVGAKLILIGLMYMGRVGILSFSLAFLTRRKQPPKVSYPTADILIG